MNKKLKFYVYFSRKFGALYIFAWQRVIMLIKYHLLKCNPPYEFEKTLPYDSDTELVVKKINQTLKNSPSSLNLNPKAESYLAPECDSIFQRDAFADKVIKAVNRVLPFSCSEKLSTFVEEIKCRGNSVIPEKNFSKGVVEDVLKYLVGKKVFSAHAVSRATKKSCLKNEVNNGVNLFGSYDIRTILGSRHLAKFIGDEDIINYVANYFGCIPTIGTVNLFWSFVQSGSDKLKGPHNFHRDCDDYKTVNVFLNLTDTEENDGSFCQIEKTHSWEQSTKILGPEKRDTVPDELNPFGRPLKAEDLFVLPFKGFGFNELYEHLYKDHARQQYGPAGIVRFADGYGLHRGMLPKSRDRLLLWVSFLLTRVTTGTAGVPHHKRAAYSEVEESIENTSLNRYVLRNIVDFRK